MKYKLNHMTTNTKAPVNLFGAAKVKAPAATTKALKKFIAAPELESKIARFNKLKDQIDADTGEMKMLEGDIKAKGRELFLKEYHAQKSKPDSFKITDASGAACMFIAMDKYTVVDETKAEILAAYEGLLEEKNTFTVNAELIDRYGEILSALIMGCKKIDEDDKSRLIEGVKTYSVAKGSIDRLLQYDQPDLIFQLINPIVSLKK